MSSRGGGARVASTRRKILAVVAREGATRGFFGFCEYLRKDPRRCDLAFFARAACAAVNAAAARGEVRPHDEDAIPGRAAMEEIHRIAGTPPCGGGSVYCRTLGKSARREAAEEYVNARIAARPTVAHWRIAAVEAYGERVGDTRLRVRCLRCGAEREMLWSALFSGTLRGCLHCGAGRKG